MEKSIDLLKVAEEICKQNNFRLLAEKGEGTFKKTYSVNKGEEIYALKVYKRTQVWSMSIPQKRTRLKSSAHRGHCAAAAINITPDPQAGSQTVIG